MENLSRQIQKINAEIVLAEINLEELKEQRDKLIKWHDDIASHIIEK